MPETGNNYAKQASYQFVSEMIKDAIRHNYPLQAITLEESVMADRLWSSLHASGLKASNHETVGAALSVWEKCTCFDEEVNSLKPEIQKWWRDRNELLHGLAKAQQGSAPKIRPEEFDEKAGEAAKTGSKLTRKLCNWSKKTITKAKRLRAKGMHVLVAFATGLACMNAFADIKVSDVEVFSGYPWKEVVVGYTISGTNVEAVVVRLDKSESKSYAAGILKGGESDGRAAYMR